MKIESQEKEFQDLVEKRKKEIQLEVDKKIHNYKIGYVTIELIALIIGYTLLCYSLGWTATTGIFLVILGNNASQNRKNW